jgi:dCMP deaminase
MVETSTQDLLSEKPGILIPFDDRRLDIGCARQGVPSGQRSELCRAAHAEQNAINFAARYGISIEGATLYTTHYPCSWCAKSIVNAGIARVIYDENYPDPLAKEILSAIQVQPIRGS